MSLLKQIKSTFKSYLKPLKNRLINRTGQENDALYRLIYECVHDKEQSLSLAAIQTKDAFAYQWDKLPEGNALLSDVWFRNNLKSILTQQELQLDPGWFIGKEVLDAGCGNGRWSYGFAELGANITAVDVNQVALDETKKALDPFNVKKEFIHSPLEQICSKVGSKKFDLVFSWGVVHHCGSFNKALEQLTQCVKEGGVLYLYLYGRESLPLKEDLSLFKDRIIYHTLFNPKEKYQFLLKKARGNHAKVHIFHDLYAPLINRRLDYDYVKKFLEEKGLHSIERTIDHTELFIRAFKGNVDHIKKYILQKKSKPYWFERYS
jgi:2-polyprenyl-3-methyl-5-hydroxy-6-metoxy-1,4-benzoquinol methylase